MAPEELDTGPGGAIPAFVVRGHSDVALDQIRDLLKTVGVDYVQGYGVEMPKEITLL